MCIKCHGIAPRDVSDENLVTHRLVCRSQQRLVLYVYPTMHKHFNTGHLMGILCVSLMCMGFYSETSRDINTSPTDQIYTLCTRSWSAEWSTNIQFILHPLHINFTIFVSLEIHCRYFPRFNFSGTFYSFSRFWLWRAYK